MLDFVIGKKQNPQAVDTLVNILRTVDWTGTLYIGYPILAADDSARVTDALLTSREHGVIIFDLTPVNGGPEKIAEQIELRQSDLYRGLHNRLFSFRELTKNKGRDLAVDINVLTLLPAPIPGLPEDAAWCTPAELLGHLDQLAPLRGELYKPLNAAIQKTAALKPKKRRLSVKKADSMGAIIKSIEAEIANLDKWQKNAAIESPEGAQRIRGLAGSGKTIILAMKAAYLHANFPDNDIVVTFNTRSLYQQFRALIGRFYYDQMQDDPDWEKLRILHAWGSASSSGVYSAIAIRAGIAPMDFGSARYRFGWNDAFKGACAELLGQLEKQELAPLWDFALIDEAQDFPVEFFKLVYRASRPPKRIVWAYDELQNLGDFVMPPLAELFGLDKRGLPLVTLSNEDGLPKQDILLPICYRNPPWTLSLALALGLGIYRDQGPVQMFDEPGFWREIGYERIAGELALGQNVALRRRADRSPEFFGNLLSRHSSIGVQQFKDETEQATFIAKSVQDALHNQELEPSDVLIIVPEAITTSAKGAVLIRALENQGIASHLAGITASRDLIFVENSVAISGIFRAKGNEAPLVYVAYADYCFGGSELSKRRNILFTAITRSKAWVQICGIGPAMEGLAGEVGRVIENDFNLSFRYPTEEEIARMRRTYREKTEEEKRAEKKEMAALRRLLEKLDSGDVLFSELPEDVANKLKGLSE